MRVLVCGGRSFYDWRLLENTLYELNKEEEITDVIHGAASGADMLASQWACYNNVRMHPYPANWKKFGPEAGPIRNQQMIDEGKPDLVVVFPGGHGTADMALRAEKACIRTKIVET